MKKILFCMLAAMMIVPTFVGCGQSTEATTNELDPNDDPLNGTDEKTYEEMMNEGAGEGEEE
ncbi:MAG: hypothetical protein AB8G99_03340 [Planctomycetaceae bacterium]